MLSKGIVELYLQSKCFRTPKPKAQKTASSKMDYLDEAVFCDFLLTIIMPRATSRRAIMWTGRSFSVGINKAVRTVPDTGTTNL